VTSAIVEAARARAAGAIALSHIMASSLHREASRYRYEGYKPSRCAETRRSVTDRVDPEAGQPLAAVGRAQWHPQNHDVIPIVVPPDPTRRDRTAPAGRRTRPDL
jgi:hypothetical protein